MPRSSSAFAISLPVEPSHGRCLPLFLATAASLTALALAGLGTGWGRLAGILPLAGGLFCLRGLAALAPLPDAVLYRPAVGWSLQLGDDEVAVRLAPESWFGRGVMLAAFRSEDGRRWLVPLRRPPSGDDWRRLRVLWRTRRAALVANSPNC